MTTHIGVLRFTRRLFGGAHWRVEPLCGCRAHGDTVVPPRQAHETTCKFCAIPALYIWDALSKEKLPPEIFEKLEEISKAGQCAAACGRLAPSGVEQPGSSSGS